MRTLESKTPVMVLAAIMFCAFCAALPMAGAAQAQSLPSYNVDRSQISVSGISSGAYMAQQFHVAFSASIMGAGLVAGGPYDCAMREFWRVAYSCSASIIPINVSTLVRITREEAARGTIDDPANLRNDRVYLFSGRRDRTVGSQVVTALYQYYNTFMNGSNISYVRNINAAHAFITPQSRNACDYAGSPYINRCGNYDQAGEILKQIYGPLTAATAPRGEVVTFDQSDFLNNPTQHGLNQHGHAYIPTACATGATCRVHAAFHGCQQTEDQIGDAFYRTTGYNEWGEANNIIILYPQTAVTPSNYQGCWDWWGYDSADYFRQSGPQMSAVKRMIDRLAAGRPLGTASRPN